MMTKKKTPKIKWVKFVWTLPVFALLLFAFAEPSYQMKESDVSGKNILTHKTISKKQFIIYGKVVRKETGEPLPAATVLIKGTTVGAAVNVDGSFTLVDPNPKVDTGTGTLSSKIVVSFVGLKTVENVVTAPGKAIDNTKITFKMEEGVILIDTDFENDKPLPLPPPNREKEVFFIVEELPQYLGGHYALGQYVSFLQKKMAKSDNIKGKAKIGFTVDAKGSVRDVKILDEDNEMAGKNAASIVLNMKNWKPGSQRGKPVPVKYLLPVEFK